ncbi:hypothetical protein [Microbacterium sp.]|uniref:hypothetical protein n=1 Tax=Microbacterium sp. TaxID=51671 RepID=UPI002810D765|nr:hypothetical protein [Microbacterium sp.]
MSSARLRLTALLAAAWSVPYIASKVHLAIIGELGVFGGPAIREADAARFGGGDVSIAQWLNAAAGVLILLVCLLALLPSSEHRSGRWRMIVIVIAGSLLTVAALGFAWMAVGGAGGVVFACYLIVWALFLWLLAAQLRRRRDSSDAPSASPAPGSAPGRASDAGR